jgi:hypothetical protein
MQAELFLNRRELLAPLPISVSSAGTFAESLAKSDVSETNQREFQAHTRKKD